MKAFFKVIIAAILASVTGLGGCTPKNMGSPGRTVKNTRLSAVTPDKALEKAAFGRDTFDVKLPILATLELSKGGSRSGKVTEIKGGRLTIQMSGEHFTVAIADVKKVMFKPDPTLSLSETSPKLRRRAETWRVTPLRGFEIKDPSSGEAEVRREFVFPVKSKEPQEDSQTFWGSSSRYQLQEMQFENPETLRLKVAPVGE